MLIAAMASSGPVPRGVEEVNIIARVVDNGSFFPRGVLRVGQVVTLKYKDHSDNTVRAEQPGTWGTVGVHYEIISETEQENNMTITNSDLVIGEVYKLTQRYEGNDKGTEIKFIERDCDNDPVFEVLSQGRYHGRRFYISQRRVVNFVEGGNKPILSNKWIAWNNIGSEMANTEAEAKRKAEAMTKRFGTPAYIAQATNAVQKNDVVWNH